MRDIRIFPGVTFEGEMNAFTVKLAKMSNESPEAFAQRCQRIADFALSFVPKKKPEVFDPSDTSKYRQVGPTSWEAILTEWPERS